MSFCWCKFSHDSFQNRFFNAHEAGLNGLFIQRVFLNRGGYCSSMHAFVKKEKKRKNMLCSFFVLNLKKGDKKLRKRPLGALKNKCQKWIHQNPHIHIWLEDITFSFATIVEYFRKIRWLEINFWAMVSSAKFLWMTHWTRISMRIFSAVRQIFIPPYFGTKFAIILGCRNQSLKNVLIRIYRNVFGKKVDSFFLS